MSWSYRKRIKIIPGIHLNLSKNGISTSVGMKGASLTFGRNGTYINTSIPGTGIYNRQKINSFNKENKENKEILISGNNTNDIFIKDIMILSSDSMLSIKEIIKSSKIQRKELKKDLFNIKFSIFNSHIKIFFSNIYNKAKKIEFKNELELKKDTKNLILNEIEGSYPYINIVCDDDIKSIYDNLYKSFNDLIRSHKIWDIIYSKNVDKIRERSFASNSVNRKNIKFTIENFSYLRSENSALCLNSVDKHKIYIYPSFIIIEKNKDDFDVISLDDIDFELSSVNFSETDSVPKDSIIKGYTWKKCNKNGTRDKRFKNNYQIPIVEYSSLILKSKGEIFRYYLISNCELSNKFFNYLKLIKNFNYKVKANSII